MREVFGVKFYSPFEVETKGFLGYKYSVRVGHFSEATKRIDYLADFYNKNKQEYWKIYKLKVMFLIVRDMNLYEEGITPDENIGLLVIEDGGNDIIFVKLGEHALVNGYELDDIVNRLISQEGFKISFLF